MARKRFFDVPADNQKFVYGIRRLPWRKTYPINWLLNMIYFCAGKLKRYLHFKGNSQFRSLEKNQGLISTPIWPCHANKSQLERFNANVVTVLTFSISEQNVILFKLLLLIYYADLMPNLNFKATVKAMGQGYHIAHNGKVNLFILFTGVSMPSPIHRDW